MTRQRLAEDGGAKPSKPHKLTKARDRTRFDSGAPELNEWLKKYSWQNLRVNNATTYVTTSGDGRVIGYYAITVAGYQRDAVPETSRSRRPRQCPVSCLRA